MHLTERPDAPPSQRLPLFILVSRGMRVVVLEGVPDYPSLKQYIEDILKMPGEQAAPAR